MEVKSPDVVIIRGAPGAGKSETAKALSQYFPKGIRLEVDTLRNMVISVNWTDQQEHIALLDITGKLTLDFLSSGYAPVIVIDTFSGNKLGGFIEKLTAQNASISTRVFGLLVSEEVLKKRLEDRPQGLFKDLEISKKLNTITIKNKLESETQIDTTTLTPDETAKLIQSIVVPTFESLS